VRRFLALLVALVMLPLPALAADVEIVPGSNINLVARDTRIPVTVKNNTDEAVTVVVKAKSTSFRLEVLSDAEVLIPPQSSAIAELPVTAIANGPVQIAVWVEQKSGERVGEDVILDINVAYDVELFLLVTLAVAMFALIIVGVIRTVIKLGRRRE
jgi:P pilus assembly chaperone PapD